MRRSLDRQRDYAECKRDPVGIKYVQDGRFFDLSGYEIDREGRPFEAPDPVPQPEPVPAEPRVSQKQAKKVAPEPEPAPSKKDQDAPLVCSSCGFVAPNQWAARAHAKVHEK